jgi:hypothetical protein
MLERMPIRWPTVVLRGVVLAMLVTLIIAITVATLMPVIYRTDWFQNRFVKSTR